MTFTPVVRYKNFLLKNLKSILEVYPDISNKVGKRDAYDIIEESLHGYKRTAYQFACQLGLEDRSVNHLKIQEYLFSFDDKYLEKYLEFWFNIYYAPNPYVNSQDTPIIIYNSIADKILNSPNMQVNYIDSFKTIFGGKSEDILLNAFKSYGSPIKHKAVSNVDYLYIDADDVDLLKNKVSFIADNFPINDASNKNAFFNRFNYQNFCLFHGIEFGSIDIVKKEEAVKEIPNDKPHNRIIYGAPGTGKSYLLNEEISKYFPDQDMVDRVTFFPGYTYGQFIGTYKPRPIYKDSNKVYHNGLDIVSDQHEPIITYEYVTGVLLNILIKAINNHDRNFCLVIEELNRVKVDSVFGDFFQLLDRDEHGNSEYRIKGSDEQLQALRLKIAEERHFIFEDGTLYIPSNLYIWATMNSADQGVFSMDTAFKRRWNFEYIQLNKGEMQYENHYVDIGKNVVLWNDLRLFINDKLKDFVPEDRLIAPFFVKKHDFIEIKNYKLLKSGILINKIVMYLREDILRHKKVNGLFYSDDVNFNDLYEAYERKENIFAIDEQYYLSDDQEENEE